MKRMLLIFGIIAAAVAGALLLPQHMSIKPPVFHQHEVWPQESSETTGLQADGTLSTHLPIIILHTDGFTVPGQDRADERKLLCSYSLIWSENGINRSDDPAVQSGSLELSIRGNTSRQFPKKQFAMKLTDGQGNPSKVSLLGMPPESTWVLNGSFIDHSQIRNYMMYNISSEIMGYAPRTRLCEVMLTDTSGTPVYQGLYTLIEKPKISENRIPLQPYDPKYTPTSFLLQMNAHIDTIRLEHLKPDDLIAYSIELEYPSELEITPESTQYIEQEVLTFEKILFDAAHTGNWTKAEEMIDINSFVDYYLINEFFQNYDAGRRSTYLYRNLDGVYNIGPVWDFDGSFNNFTQINLGIDYLDLQSTFYYHYLTQDPHFSRLCVQRYQELRRTFLSEEYLLNYIDSTIDYLGSAFMRNCDRWYEGKTALLEEDLKKMRTFVQIRGLWMDDHFSAFSTNIS